MEYDYLIVGTGLFGAVCANEFKKQGKKVLCIEKRDKVGGNIRTENVSGIDVHVYGAHIFHTNNKEVWEHVNQFSNFNRYTNSPIANYNGEIYSLPFNMYTFNKMWGVTTPAEAKAVIDEQVKAAGIGEPQNLEEQAIKLVGTDIYERLVKCYTEKQWGRKCSELPSFIIKRLPVRFTYNNNYFDALYQGIPEDGYTKMIERMLDGVDVITGVDFLKERETYVSKAEKVLYTGPIDAYFDFKLGNLEYRSLKFETETLETANYQGNAVVNYTGSDYPWTRIIEHKWFRFGKDSAGNEIPQTIITREFSKEWQVGDEPYYPVNDETNNKLFSEYEKLAEGEKNVHFGGRLAEYKYYDMDKIVEKALNFSKNAEF